MKPTDGALTMEELLVKIKDQSWRLNNLYWVINEKGKKVRFRLRPVQKKLLDNLWFRNVILKSRQHGISTFMCIFFLDLCLFKRNIHCGICAHRLDDAKSFLSNKIKFAYDNLPAAIRALVATGKEAGGRDSMGEIQFSNGSMITVGTSLRSGTYQYVHISEHGKICAQFPRKAQELKTGALNTVGAVGDTYVFIESTAEGRAGDFFTFCENALKRQAAGTMPTPLEYHLHFFGWFEDAKNRMDPAGVVIPQEMHEYFAEFEGVTGVKLDDWQKAWYVMKRREQGVDEMYQEFPGTPEEAFQKSVKGTYYRTQMIWLRSQFPKRLANVPWEPRLKVDTGWDLGLNDKTCIVFRQRVGGENRVIDWYENTGEGLDHYVKMLQEKPYVYGAHYLPHDVKVRSLNDAVSREDKLYELGLRNIVTVERTANVEDGIQEVRSFLLTCWFDLAKCDRLIAALDAYRKKWNASLGDFTAQPEHDWASDPADAFRCLACGISSNETAVCDDPFFRRATGRWRTM